MERIEQNSVVEIELKAKMNIHFTDEEMEQLKLSHKTMADLYQAIGESIEECLEEEIDADFTTLKIQSLLVRKAKGE